MFIDKIKTKLKELFPNLNLSKERVEAIAKAVNSGITEEEAIETQLNLVNSVTPFAELARLDDVERNFKSRKPETPPAPVPAPETKQDDEIPAWAKALVESNKELKEQLAGQQVATLKEKRTATFKASIKDLPKEMQELRLKSFNRMSFENDEDFNEYITDTTAEVSAHVQAEKDSQNSGYRPQTPSKDVTLSKAEQESIDEAVAGMNF